MHHPFTLESVKKGSLKLEGTGRVFPVLLTPAALTKDDAHQCMGFHFAMWLASNPEIHDYRLTVDMDICDAPVTNARFQSVYILFGQLKDKNSFQRWLKRYRKWFGEQDMTKKYFPDLPGTGRHALSFITIPSGMKMDISMMEFKFPPDSVDRWVWVLRNCRRPVYVTPEGLGFVSSKEAVHFKLKWG